MIYIVKINDKEYEVEVEKGTANIVRTTTAKTPVVMQPAPAAPSPAENPNPSISVGEGIPIHAPMPGTILEIKATVGTHVKKGDCLLILEAMKMENEIVAPSDGTVRQILTAKGSMVSTGDPLAVIG